MARAYLALTLLIASCSSPLATRDEVELPCSTCDASSSVGGDEIDAAQRLPSAARIAPPSATLNENDEISFTVWLVDTEETLVPTPSTPSYVSSQPSVMSVTTNGRATAITAGNTIITATLDGFAAQASIEVQGPGAPDAGTGPAFDPAACCPSVANQSDPSDINMCFAGGPTPPSSADPDCPMVFSGGYCANPSPTDFANGDWNRGYNEAHEFCCSFHPSAAGC